MGRLLGWPLSVFLQLSALPHVPAGFPAVVFLRQPVQVVNDIPSTSAKWHLVVRIVRWAGSTRLARRGAGVSRAELPHDLPRSLTGLDRAKREQEQEE